MATKIHPKYLMKPTDIAAEGKEATERLTRELGIGTVVADVMAASSSMIAGRGHLASMTTTAHHTAGISLSPAPPMSASFSEGIESLVKEIVLKVLEDERVLVHISGKVKQYCREQIAISKSDPGISEIKVEEPAKPIPGFMEELSKLR